MLFFPEELEQAKAFYKKTGKLPEFRLVVLSVPPVYSKQCECDAFRVVKKDDSEVWEPVWNDIGVRVGEDFYPWSAVIKSWIVFDNKYK